MQFINRYPSISWLTFILGLFAAFIIRVIGNIYPNFRIYGNILVICIYILGFLCSIILFNKYLKTKEKKFLFHSIPGIILNGIIVFIFVPYIIYRFY